MVIVAHAAIGVALAQAEAGAGRAVVQQHQLGAAKGGHQHGGIARHQGGQLRTGELPGGGDEFAALGVQHLGRAAVGEREALARTHGDGPSHAQLTGAAQHHAAELVAIRGDEAVQHVQGCLLALHGQVEPHALCQLAEAAFEGLRAEVLRVPDQSGFEGFDGLILGHAAENDRLRHIARWQDAVLHRALAGILPGEILRALVFQGDEGIATQGVQRGHGHKGIVREHGALAHFKGRVAHFGQGFTRVLVGHGALLSSGDHIAGHRHGGRAVRGGQGQGLAHQGHEGQVAGDFRNFHAAGGFQLSAAGQAVDAVPRADLHVRAQPQHGDLPSQGVAAGINHLVVAAVAADLQAVAVVQFAGEAHAGHAARHGLDGADGHAAVVDALGVDHACVLHAHGVAAHQSAPGENLLQAVHFIFIRLAEGAGSQQINALAVAGGDGRHVLRALEAALQLDGAGAGLDKVGQVVAHAHVAGAEPGGGFALISIGQTAGLGAAATVAGASADHGGEQALAADRHALGAMAKDLHLDTHVGRLADFAQGALAGQHDATQPVLLAEFRAGRVVQRHLGGRMHRQIREAGAAEVHHAQILHEDGVHLDLVEQPQHILYAGEFPILDEGIDRHMHADVVQMGEMHGLAELGFIKIASAGAGREGRVAQIDRVSASCSGPVEGFPVARGSQVFQGGHRPMFYLIHFDSRRAVSSRRRREFSSWAFISSSAMFIAVSTATFSRFIRAAYMVSVMRRST